MQAYLLLNKTNRVLQNSVGMNEQQPQIAQIK